MNWLYQGIRYALVHWGYWAVMAGLLCESAGLPVPGESTLMFASFLAHKTPQLKIEWVIAAGIAGAVLGDNSGYWLGRRFGPRFLRWLDRHFHMKDDVATAREQIRRHGPATIFWARYIFGLRTIAGPVAGALGMEWRVFLLFNVLGGASWVALMSLCGYLFAKEFRTLLDFFEKASWGIGAGIFLLGYIYWRHKKKKFHESNEGEKAT